MEKKPQIPEKDNAPVPHANEETAEREMDVDSRIHETSPDLIQKEEHRLEVDDEVKKG